MEISFLFGAGISTAVNLDDTTTLTDKVLEGKNIVRISSKYYFHDNPEEFKWDFYQEYINRTHLLFKIIKKYFGDDSAFRNGEMNYEDYYFIINSIYHNENMEYENPLVSYYRDYLENNYNELYTSISDTGFKERTIDICSEAKNYIEDIVCMNLNREASNLNHLNFINQLLQENNSIKLNIFTLNHDKIIEKFLKYNKISYSNGFKSSDNNICIWNPNNYISNICLFKLHGSIDWYYSQGDTPYKNNICIYTDNLRNADRPLILIGTFNKLQQYTRAYYFELQCLFQERLQKTNILIISGYSFGDQGINSRIIYWLFKSTKNKIIVIHPEPDKLIKNARPAIHNQWDYLLKNKALQIIPKMIQNVNWDDIKEYL